MEQLFWIQGRDKKHLSLIAHFPKGDTDTKIERHPAIVYCHGFTGNKTGDNRIGVNLARALCEQGFVVIRFDYIGSGESEGDFATDTYFSGWISDLKVILDWTQSLKVVDQERIGIIGHSLGGALVTHCGQSEHVKAICALAPASKLEENFREIIIGPKKWKEMVEGKTISDFYNKKYSLAPKFAQDLLQYDIGSKAKEMKKPFLIIHGKKDQAVPYTDSYTLYEHIQTDEKELAILDDEEHLLSTEIHPKIIAWFKEKI